MDGFQSENLRFTVPAPAPRKDVASIQKLFFQSFTMMHFVKLCLFLLYTIAQNSEKNASILGIFLDAASVQERPLLARIRYSMIKKLVAI